MVFGSIRKRILQAQIQKANKVSKTTAKKLKSKAQKLREKEKKQAELDKLKLQLKRAKQIKGLSPAEKKALKKRQEVVDKRINAVKKGAKETFSFIQKTAQNINKELERQARAERAAEKRKKTLAKKRRAKKRSRKR